MVPANPSVDGVFQKGEKMGLNGLQLICCHTAPCNATQHRRCGWASFYLVGCSVIRNECSKEGRKERTHVWLLSSVNFIDEFCNAISMHCCEFHQMKWWKDQILHQRRSFFFWHLCSLLPYPGSSVSGGIHREDAGTSGARVRYCILGVDWHCCCNHLWCVFLYP